ncbi:MAG: 30S ribosomal protein S6 [Candidatus Nomurabacteria bacterium]|nr:30S ribosomal protein S6 [Candidatus Nomurabacteria bacterium]
MEENTKKVIKEEGDARVYEVGYLLSNAIEEGDVAAEYGNLKELVSSLGGEIISDEMPKDIELAYTIEKVIANIKHKFNNAYFGWVKFAMDPEKVLELKKKLDLDVKIVRFLILKTVRENTVATKKFARATEGGAVTKKYTPKIRAEGEEVPEINKEEIDKEIDAMIEA